MSRHGGGEHETRPVSATDRDSATDQRIKDACRALDRVVDVLRHEGRRQDEFGRLALGLLEKDVVQLANTAEMIRPRSGGGGCARKSSSDARDHHDSRAELHRGDSETRDKGRGVSGDSGHARNDDDNSSTARHDHLLRREAPSDIRTSQSRTRNESHRRSDVRTSDMNTRNSSRRALDPKPFAGFASERRPLAPKRKIVLQGQNVFASIAHALLEFGSEGKRTVLNLAVVHKGVDSDACIEAVWQTLTISSLDKCASDKAYLSQHPEHAAKIKCIVIKPLDASSNSAIVDLSEVVSSVRQLVLCCPNLLSVQEDFSAFDWDVSNVNNDWVVTLPTSLSLVSIASNKCWWELRALLDLLKNVRGTLKSLRLSGAVMDRDWSGPGLLKRSTKDQVTTIKSLELAQVMHTDTLSALLRLTPRLETLRVSFQVVGTTDNDTPLDSILDALSHVSGTLTCLRMTSPFKKGDQETKHLLESVVQLLPALEVLEFQEDRASSQSNEVSEKVVEIASPQLLVNLPINLRLLRGRGISSFSTGDVRCLLESKEQMAPALKVLDLCWSLTQDGQMRVERDVRELDKACKSVGVQGRFRCGVDESW
ncbi:hypothetical protein ACM66B_006582 [Microbotryomycetes sp. NB124-2]